MRWVTAVVAAWGAVSGVRVSPVGAQCTAHELSQIKAPGPWVGFQFGAAMDMFGDLVVVGDPLDSVEYNSAGAAYVYGYSGGAWVSQGRLTASDPRWGAAFGFSVSIHANFLLVGAPHDDEAGPQAGAAYVFRHNGSAWVEQVKLQAADPGAGDQFGHAVALGDGVALITAVEDSDQGSQSGSLYVFRFDGTDWNQEAKLYASEPAPYERFGQSAALDAGAAVVGANGDNGTGAAYVFRQGPGGWAEEGRVAAPDAGDGDWFGYSVGISGNVLVAGALHNDDAGESSGSAYVFRRDTAGRWRHESKLTAWDAAADDRFGVSVGVSGDVVVVGAFLDDDGANRAGSAYVYRRQGGAWAPAAKLTASNPGVEDIFGAAVAVGGGRVLVGSNTDDLVNDDYGTVYVFGGIDDCNENLVLDLCDVVGGTSQDSDGDGIPNECDCVSNADCSDGLFCNGVEVCAAGVCGPGSSPCPAGLACNEATDHCDCDDAADCNDNIACTTDACVAGACTFTPNPSACPDDGLFCNGTETCSATAGCTHSGNPCAAAGKVCDEATDSCLACDNSTQCDDGLFCNGVEVCLNGLCASGPVPCPGQGCDEQQNSCFTPPDCVADAECDDGQFCTGQERCAGGSCVAGVDPCPGMSCNEAAGECFQPECTTASDCDDEDVCTLDVCEGGRCRNIALVGCQDADRDGVVDANDECPGTPSGAAVDAGGCACDQRDADSDGVGDCSDACPSTADGAAVNEQGCSCDVFDGDADGLNDCLDACPETPAGAAVDGSGCAPTERDSDSDGVFDAGDNCPETEPGLAVDESGCAEAQRDDDGDGVADPLDACPDTPAGQVPDGNGCAYSQVDRDGDGVFDAFDACLDTPLGERVNGAGCSASQLSGESEAGAAIGAGAGASRGTGPCGGLGLIAPLCLLAGLVLLRVRGGRSG